MDSNAPGPNLLSLGSTLGMTGGLGLVHLGGQCAQSPAGPIIASTMDLDNGPMAPAISLCWQMRCKDQGLTCRLMDFWLLLTGMCKHAKEVLNGFGLRPKDHAHKHAMDGLKPVRHMTVATQFQG